MKGKEDEGSSRKRSELQPLEYTNLPYGDYRLKIRVLDSEGKKSFSDSEFI